MFETCQDLQRRPQDILFTRRQFLNRLGMGFGGMSLAGLIGMGILDPVENAAESFALVATTHDCQEGLNAFVEKRAPSYRGC